MVSELIEGIAAQLHGINSASVYVDDVDNNVKFPCWRIVSTDDITLDHLVGDRYENTVEFDIWYMLNEYGEISDVRTEIHNLAETAMFSLEFVKLSDGSQIRGQNMHYRITDGVLHIFVEYAYHVRRVKPTGNLMQKLVTDGDVKE